MKNSRTLTKALVASTLAAAGIVPIVISQADAAPTGFSLGLNEAKFWDGGYVTSAVTSNLPEAVACAQTTCFDWDLKVAAKGERLRVAIQTPSREDAFSLELIDPQGKVAGSSDASGVFAQEVYIHQPAGGTWKARVIPRNATFASFQMRAKLEASAKKLAPKTVLLPNLQATPPYEFGFIAPANPANGVYPPDTVNPPLDVLGYAPLSCTADESLDMTNLTFGPDRPTRCLRFTTGPRNMGPGIFEVHYSTHDLSNGLGITAKGPATQFIYRADGSHIEHPAGVFQFHLQHAHYHYNDILDYQLFKVTDAAKGTLVKSGKGVKSGFCPADQLLADWKAFNNEEGSFVEANCGYNVDGDGAIGQSAGWGDVYRWQRPGQFVDWGTNTDGLYVVRSTVDILNHVMETNEKDNAGYAYIRVVGTNVTILERGQGQSPWDPNKKVFTDQ